MTDIRASLRSRYETALATDSNVDWHEVDRLTVDISKRCPVAIDDLRALVEHAIIRLGGIPGECPFPGVPSETWMEYVLGTVFRGLQNIDVQHTNLSAPLIMHSIGRDAKLVRVSEAWCQMLNYRAEEALGMPSVAFLTDESRKMAIDFYLPEFWEVGSLSRVEYDFLTKTGKKVPIELSATAERDSEGAISRTLAVISKR